MFLLKGRNVLKNSPIAIFDSGVGGLTVVREVMEVLPSEKLIYLGDSARCPYGPRDLEEVKGFAFEILEYLTSLSVKLVVVACNTATAAALVELQNAFLIPIVGVISPGAHAAVQSTRNRSIAVIATEATIKSEIYQKIILLLDAGARVTSVACPRFVEFVEKGEIDSEELRELAKVYFVPLVRNEVDTVILGCTHYPLLRDTISESLGRDVELISSAKETANEVKSILMRRNLLRQEKERPDHLFLSTGSAEQFIKLGSRFLGRKIDSVEVIKL